MSARIFENQTAIVTGAGQGIGFEICRLLSLQGARVMLNDIDPSLAQKAATLIREERGVCEGFPADVADFEAVCMLVQRTVNLFGRLDLVVANAGITLFGEFLTYPAESLRKVLDLNLAGSFFLIQQAALQMIKQGEGGSLLLMSSVTGHQAHRNLAAYSMTKAGLEMLAKNLVIELSPHQININAIAPGATITERTVEDPDYEKTWSEITPLGRPANTIDIAQAAAFLLSKSARHITGQSLVVDGGWTSVSPSPYPHKH